MDIKLIQSAKILIVDDHESNILLLRKMLEIHHFWNIDYLTDSRQVSAYYIEHRPDLILLDLKMPYMDGFEVLEALNDLKEDNFLPVIMITAMGDQANKFRALSLGVREFISKPFDQIEVMMRIQNVLEIKLLHEDVKQQNKHLEIKVAERTQALKHMQLELIERLLKAAEFRDRSTGFHITRIGYFAQAFAKILGLSDKECDTILYASMMHDIGKIGISDTILLKPGQLTEEERELMKLHTLKGAEILKNSQSDFIRMGEIIALNHHEQWNGQGYPHGLKGEEIPIVARITTIVDVFDALMSPRPYKDAWEINKVIQELQSLSGQLLDPRLTEIFLLHIDTFLDIRGIYQE